MLTLATTARTSGGEELDLDIRVSRSFPADSPEVADLREILLASCGDGFLDAARLDTEKWGLVRVSVTAIEHRAGSWPGDAVLSLVTAGQEGTGEAALASAGTVLAPIEDLSGESGPCIAPRGIAGPGESDFVLGLRHDYFSDEALAGVFWSARRYGVSGVEHLESGEPRIVADIVECVVTKTPLGEELAAPEIGYEIIEGTNECSAGRALPN